MNCAYCEKELKEEFDFCPFCGGIIKDANYEELLGIKITDDDIADYIIKGFVSKTVSIGNKMSISIRTLTSGEWKEATKAADGADPGRSSRMLYNIELNQRLAACAIEAINSNMINYSGEQKYKYIQGLSSDIVELIATKANMLHQVMIKKIQEGQVANF